MTLSIIARDITDENGNLLEGAIVTVRVGHASGGALAELFTDAAGTTPAANPHTAADGTVSVYAAPGRYRLEGTSAAGGGVALLDVGAINTGRFADGTASQPGVSFASDINTGFYRPAADQIGLVTGGAQRALLNSSAFTLTVPIVAPGGALTGLTDFKMVSTPVVANIDAPGFTSGIFRRNNTGGSPPANQNGFAAMLQYGYDANNHFQLYSGILHDEMRFRRFRTESGGNQPWHEVLMRNESTGIVSMRGVGASSTTFMQTSAHPLIFGTANSERMRIDAAGKLLSPNGAAFVGTVNNTGDGAPMQRGSNGNGEFVRFADGTQICWRTMNASNSQDQTWTFPAAFSVAPVVSGTVVAIISNVRLFQLAADPTATAATFNIITTASARTAGVAHVIAIGRWF